MKKFLSKRNSSQTYHRMSSKTCRYHLEYAATTCQSTMTAFFDDTHMIQALRGKDNFCCALIDTNIGMLEGTIEKFDFVISL